MSAGSSAGTSTSTGGGSEQPQRNRSGTIIAVLSVVTAALGVVAAAFGIFANSKSNEASTQAGVATSAVSSASLAQNEADSTIQALQSANSVLNSQLSARPTITVTETAAGAAPASTAATAAAAAGQVRHQGEITLARGGGSIDLNAPASDPRWGYTTEQRYSSDRAYISTAPTSLRMQNVQTAPLTDGEIADYQTCKSKTTYVAQGVISADQLSDTPKACLLLASGHFGTVRLVSQQEGEYRLEFTIWQ